MLTCYTALFANSHIVAELVSTALPANQWQLEVLGWFQTSLARLQASVLEYVYKADLDPALTVWGPYGLAPNPTQTIGTIKAYQDQCRSQLVQTAGEVQNFSFLGVMVIVCVSVILMLLNLLMPSILKLVNRRKRWSSPAHRARQSDDKLHLLRNAISSGGNAARWELGAWDVPIIRGNNAMFPPEMDGDLATFSKNTPMQLYTEIPEKDRLVRASLYPGA